MEGTIQIPGLRIGLLNIFYIKPIKFLPLLLIILVSCSQHEENKSKVISEAILLKHLSKGVRVSELEEKIGTELTLISRGQYIPAIETKTLLSNEIKTYIFKVRVEINKFYIESWRTTNLSISVLKD